MVEMLMLAPYLVLQNVGEFCLGDIYPSQCPSCFLAVMVMVLKISRCVLGILKLLECMFPGHKA